jgi:SpoIID/LytB domain protein
MNEPLINIGILTGKRIRLGFYGDYKTSQSNKIFNGLYKVELAGNKIVLSDKNDKYEFTDNLIITPSDPTTEYFSIKDVVIGVQYHWERKEKQNFKGSIKILINDDALTVINQISLEDYLTSVVSSEMSPRCNLELLKAHAIISRSWVLAQLNKTKPVNNTKAEAKNLKDSDEERIRWYSREDHKLFDFCADDHCQRYQGITKIFTDSARQAIQVTKGLVLYYKNEICDTRFSKSCGGISEAFENVWEPVKHPYLTPVIDYKYEDDNFNLDFSKEKNARKWITSQPNAYCNTNDQKLLSQILLDYDQETTDFYRWKVEYTQEEISKLIKEKSKIDFGQIIDLVPIERGASGRLIKLKIIGTKKTLIIGKELEIRKTLSRAHLYSSAIIIDKQNIATGIPQKFIIYGAGWGHGVGFCQIGAAVMSELGYKFDEILTHYYKNSILKKIY